LKNQKEARYHDNRLASSLCASRGGTDYPPNFTDAPKAARNYIDNIRKLELPSASIEAMLHGNAAKLLGI